jgi:hypothetical protein
MGSAACLAVTVFTWTLPDSFLPAPPGRPSSTDPGIGYHLAVRTYFSTPTITKAERPINLGRFTHASGDPVLPFFVRRRKGKLRVTRRGTGRFDEIIEGVRL